MKNIIPFCVDMSDKTEAEVRELHKMCLDAGAEEYESASSWVRQWKENEGYYFMGVGEESEQDCDTFAGLDTLYFDENLITLEEVPLHLGLTTSETTPLSDSYTKWTKSMQKEGTPLSVGMLAVLNVQSHFNEKEVLVLGIGAKLVLFEVEGSEDCLPREFVMPFPDEETTEQKEQREEFIDVVVDGMSLMDAEGLYEDIKHLFKY